MHLFYLLLSLLLVAGLYAAVYFGGADSRIDEPRHGWPQQR